MGEISTSPLGALEDLVGDIKSIFKKYGLSSRKKAWHALEKPPGKKLIHRLIDNPKIQTPGLSRLLTFREFIEFAESQYQLELPPIPSDFVRLTHFTSSNIVPKILKNGLNYRRVGIDSTTDSFSTNDEIVQLIQSGNTGPFNRSHFGSSVILMDLSQKEYRFHRSFERSPGYVDSSRIVGFVDAKTGTFTPNPNYNPNKPVQYPEMPVRPNKFSAPQTSDDNSVPIPQPTVSNSSEIF